MRAPCTDSHATAPHEAIARGALDIHKAGPRGDPLRRGFLRATPGSVCAAFAQESLPRAPAPPPARSPAIAAVHLGRRRAAPGRGRPAPAPAPATAAAWPEEADDSDEDALAAWHIFQGLILGAATF